MQSRRNAANRCNIYPDKRACRTCVWSTNPELFDGLCRNPERWAYIRNQIEQEQKLLHRGTA